MKACFLVAVLASAAPAVAQDPVSSSTKWWSYVAEHDGKLGSTRVDMGQRDRAPEKNLPWVVIAGTSYKLLLESGLPTASELRQLNGFSDQVILALLEHGPAVYVGTFTQDGEQLHYVYAKDVTGLEEAFATALKRACSTCDVIFKTQRDPEWDVYLKFLYPSAAMLEFYRSGSRQQDAPPR
jgi:hypothetical protein